MTTLIGAFVPESTCGDGCFDHIPGTAERELAEKISKKSFDSEDDVRKFIDEETDFEGPSNEEALIITDIETFCNVFNEGLAPEGYQWSIDEVVLFPVNITE